MHAARKAGAGFARPDEHPVASVIGDPGVDLGRGAHVLAGQMGLGDIGGPVVGADMAVDVEQAAGVFVAGQMMLGQHPQQLVSGSLPGQLLQTQTHRRNLRSPVESEEPSDRHRVDTGETLSPSLAQQHHEHQRQDQGP